MKTSNKIIAFCCLFVLASCSLVELDVQKDYKYEKSALDPRINKTARQYLLDRGKNPVIPNDTVFKWMQLGLEYAGIDLAEYEKPGRTFILLSNNSIRVRNAGTGAITAGMWFTFPIMDKNPDGSQKFAADGITPVSRAAVRWNEYPKEDVKNYFLSLIIAADYGFSNADILNTSMPTLLPAGSKASTASRLGYFVAGTVPNYDTFGNRILSFTDFKTPGNGFDPEGKINMKIVNGDYSPLNVNDLTTVSTSGIVATNGQVHVCSTVVYPWRY